MHSSCRNARAHVQSSQGSNVAAAPSRHPHPQIDSGINIAESMSGIKAKSDISGR